MKQAVTLVFDIGKTTKKALVFDRAYHVQQERTECFREIPDDDGFPGENLKLLSQWVKETTQEFLLHEKYAVTHLNISAYGASLVGTDANDNLLEPFYNYLKPYPQKTAQLFQERYNQSNDIETVTASPWLGMLNSGLQAFWLKHEKPDLFRRIQTLLHFPQYFPFLLTGKKFCELTSVGCHTMLWDFQKKTYHQWTHNEGIQNLFPGMVPTNYCFQSTIFGKDICVGAGVHDSSAALMPYLVSLREPFLLLSTGTWNICFNPFNEAPLTTHELKRDCLSYLTFEGRPVKASRIFLGHEHEVQQKALTKFFNVDPELHKSAVFNEHTYKKLATEDHAQKIFYPLSMQDSGPLRDPQTKVTDYTAFENFEEAQHQLMRNLVQWQKLSLDLVDPQRKIKNLILVGGFSKSKLFLEVFQREIPERTLFLSDHPRASALGAAWLVNDADSYSKADKLLSIIPFR